MRQPSRTGKGTTNDWRRDWTCPNRYRGQLRRNPAPFRRPRRRPGARGLGREDTQPATATSPTSTTATVFGTSSDQMRVEPLGVRVVAALDDVEVALL